MGTEAHRDSVPCDTVVLLTKEVSVLPFRFRVNGVDLLPYIAENGIKWTRFDVEAPDTGRTLDGVMHRGRVAKKIRLDVSCRPLLSAEAAVVLNAIEPEYVTVQYVDPMSGPVVKTMYSNNIPVTCSAAFDSDTALWRDLTFPLVER